MHDAFNRFGVAATGHGLVTIDGDNLGPVRSCAWTPS